MLCLSFGLTATFLRYTRASVLEVMRQDHVTTARAKGLGEILVRRRHILRNALLPIVTVLGVVLPPLITGRAVRRVAVPVAGCGPADVERDPDP